MPYDYASADLASWNRIPDAAKSRWGNSFDAFTQDRASQRQERPAGTQSVTNGIAAPVQTQALQYGSNSAEGVVGGPLMGYASLAGGYSSPGLNPGLPNYNNRALNTLLATGQTPRDDLGALNSTSAFYTGASSSDGGVTAPQGGQPASYQAPPAVGRTPVPVPAAPASNPLTFGSDPATQGATQTPVGGPWTLSRKATPSFWRPSYR